MPGGKERGNRRIRKKRERKREEAKEKGRGKKHRRKKSDTQIRKELGKAELKGKGMYIE